MLAQCSVSIPPGNLKKMVFRRFLGLWKWNIELRWINLREIDPAGFLPAQC